MDLSRIDSILSVECKLHKEVPVVVGVSGGADSLCLLHVLVDMGFSVIVAHVNHQLRHSADDDEKIVREIARTLGLPFYTKKVDVTEYARLKKISIEESARLLRYEYLFEVAKETCSQALAVAHHADDQVETVLMHLLRGAGLGGMRGMAYRSFLHGYANNIPIVRPLLGVWREEIDKYCLEHHLEPCVDSTNTDTRYFRNRIRQELIPRLVTFNPGAKQHLWQLALLAQDEDAFIDNVVQVSLKAILAAKGKGFFVFQRVEFVDYAPALQRRILRTMIALLRSDLRDIGFSAVEKGIEFARHKATKGEWQLLDGVWLTRFSPRELLLFTNEADFSALFPILSVEKKLHLQIPGVTKLNEFWEIAASIETIEPSLKKEMINEVHFDMSSLRENLFVRMPFIGERILPFGKAEISQKLSDLFINLSVPRRVRSQWPLLCCGSDLIWVVGLRRGKFAPVNTGTKEILKLTLQRRN